MTINTAEAIHQQLVAAMETRARGSTGEVRRVLDARLAAVRARCVDGGAGVVDLKAHDNASPPGLGSLGKLLERIGSDTCDERAAYPELPLLAEFRSLWSALRIDSQLQQSVAQAPTHAGPLNSAALVSRAIALMGELSPGYLRQFLAYADDLVWLEQMARVAPEIAAGPATTKPGRRNPGTRKRAGRGTST